MSEAEVFEVLRAALWAAVLMGAPILVVTLILGFTIGLGQALTSIQEMTLTFVPKLMAIIVVFWLSMSFMTETLVGESKPLSVCRRTLQRDGRMRMDISKRTPDGHTVSMTAIATRARPPRLVHQC